MSPVVKVDKSAATTLSSAVRQAGSFPGKYLTTVSSVGPGPVEPDGELEFVTVAVTTGRMLSGDFPFASSGHVAHALQPFALMVEQLV
jgi:hypothetical protein